MVTEITGTEGQRQERETSAQRRARELRETHEGTYGDQTVDQLKDSIVAVLREIEDHEEEKKAQAKAWSDLIKQKKGAVQYCRERIDFLNSPAAEAGTDQIPLPLE